MAFDIEQCRVNLKRRAAAQQQGREALRHQARRAAVAAVRQVLLRYPQITQVYLFGSITRPGQFHGRSDIDIAVAGTDAATYFDLWRDLEATCVDWAIDLREINSPSHFTDVVCQTGELIYDTAGGTAEG